ncbi:hypothetical protein [Synechococcus sp. M16CYN]
MAGTLETVNPFEAIPALDWLKLPEGILATGDGPDGLYTSYVS